VDVVNIAPDSPQREAMRQKFLDEHFHKGVDPPLRLESMG
jgi:cupin superfamily acireductone dioxygenase involved in methionine salvage